MKDPAILFVVLVLAVLIAGCGKGPDTTGPSPEVTPATEEATPAADKLITNSIGMKLVLIPAGEFMMGSPESEEDRLDNEKQHPVRITRPFYLGMYEVTQEQYEQVVGTNPSEFKGATRPVEMVSWDDAVEFCRKLSAQEGRTYRLPTEAEWEYACRAGTSTLWSFGDDGSKLQDHTWFSENAGRTAHPVGQKKPNAWGLYDMHGNVLEWCQDWYDSDYYADSPTDDPKGPTSGSYRVSRGGGWDFLAGSCRSASRYGRLPGRESFYLGFRLALVPAD